MQTSNTRRGHVPQISISDDNHHVTEAIGTLYDDSYYSKRESRPLSFMPSPLNDAYHSQPAQTSPVSSPVMLNGRKSLSRHASGGRPSPRPTGQGYGMGSRSNSFGKEHVPISPPSGPVRSPSDTANSSFPLNDLDYESNPAAVAQELSNLQALRRMSMDVNAAGDPDLPAFNSAFGMPTIAPTGSADEDDTSRLFWVPARLHPELAPKEFKTFLDSRVNSIKRRSGDSSLSPGGPERHGSGGGLRRKKSMLSRQIDNSEGRGAEGYEDGAERLDRKRSLSGAEALNTGISNLQDLEVLVNDPSRVIQRLSIDTGQKATGGEVPASEDMPILPAAPGNSLRRSTRTTYHRGSLRKGERVPPSKRAVKSAEPDPDELSSASPVTPATDLPEVTRIRTPPTPVNDRPPANFSRPGRMNRDRVISPNKPPVASYDKGAALHSNGPVSHDNGSTHSDRVQASPVVVTSDSNGWSVASNPVVPPISQPIPHFVSQIASNGRSTVQPQARSPQSRILPQIVVEEPPVPDETRAAPQLAPKSHVPERVSSHEAPPSQPPLGPLPTGPPSLRGSKRPGLTRQNQSEKGSQTLRDMAAHPSPLPGNSTRTDSLSFIPTLTEDKKADSKKSATKKEANEGVKKSSWSWGSLLGSEEKEKEKRREEEAREASKKGKSKTKPLDKTHDNTRLDVLQTTMEGGRSRESLVLDRGDLKLEEERKKESSRKASGDSKKEKESGLFSSFFGGAKKKIERESLGKKSSRNLSPDPPHQTLRPDVDYNWTRFSILEERAIYRMAHIKLANPRRALYSQVLLSNFMYSYLAKVQQMHPQIQIPQTVAQKAQQRQQQEKAQQEAQRKADQPEEFSQYQKYQEQQQLQEQQAHAQAQAPNQPTQREGVAYVDGAQNYNYDHGDQDSRYRPQSRASQHSLHGADNSNGHYAINGGSSHHRGGSHQNSGHQYPQSQFDDPRRSEDDDMW